MLFEHITAEHLTLKLAETPDEVKGAQRLRYEVFHKELGATINPEMAALGYDADDYDALCDHLIVVDNNLPKDQQIVGTYRLLTRDQANKAGVPLYTESEFNIDKLKATGGKIMEMSRSCIAEPYRTKTAINLLWKGIAACVFGNKIDYLIGVPSFNGRDPKEHLEAISYMMHYHPCREDIRPVVQPEHRVELELIPKDQLDVKRIFADLPPLFKGYVRIGVSVGDGIYIDHEFNMVDMCVVLDIANVTDRYFNHYKRYDKSDE